MSEGHVELQGLKMKKDFPPPSLKCLDRDSAGLFVGLLKTLRSQSTVLVLGSGVSAAVGAPTWTRLLTLVSESFFNHLDYTRLRKGIPAERISIAFTAFDLLKSINPEAFGFTAPIPNAFGMGSQ